jgi:uncharacterized protein (UPF0332 family)
VFDPKEFIIVCQSLCCPGRSEAEYRTAISRALYGVFLWAREELENREQKVKVLGNDKSSEHSKVRERFKHGKFRNDQVSQRLGALYDLRWRSDYVLDTSIKHTDVQQALLYVDYIKEAFETLFPPPNPPT